MMVGGDTRTLERVRKVLETIGNNIFLVDDVGCGTIAKLINNMIRMPCQLTPGLIRGGKTMEGMIIKNKFWLKILLLINGLMEGGFGIYVLTFPDGMSRTLGCPPLNHVSYLLVSRMYGLAALCLGILSLGLVIRRTWPDFLGLCLLVFTVFHLGMAVIQFIDNQDWSSCLIHVVLGLPFLVFYLRHLSTRQETG